MVHRGEMVSEDAAPVVRGPLGNSEIDDEASQVFARRSAEGSRIVDQRIRPKAYHDLLAAPSLKAGHRLVSADVLAALDVEQLA